MTQLNRSLNQPQGKFKFNSQGICENPEVVLQHSGNKYEYTLTVCEGPAGWMAGYDITIRGTAVGCGQRISAPSKKGTIYFNRQIALLDIANQVHEHFGNKDHRELSMLKAFIAFHQDKNFMDIALEIPGIEDLLNSKTTSATPVLIKGEEIAAAMTKILKEEIEPVLDKYTTGENWDINAAPKTPLIKFVKMRAPKSAGERNLFMKLDGKHAGDWLNDPTDMSGAIRLAENAIKEIEANPKFKYLRRLSVELSEKPFYVKIYSSSYVKEAKNDKEMICCFIPYNMTMADLLFNDTPVSAVTGGHDHDDKKDIAELWRPDGPNDLNAITRENALKHKSMFAWKIPQAQKNFDHFNNILQKGKFDPGLTKEAVEDLAERQRIFLIQLEAGMEQVKFILSTKTNTKMALSKVTPGPGTSSMTMVPIGNIIPSPTNKLHREPWELDEKQDPTFAEMIKSIQLRGVDQSLLCRPNEKQGMFYLVCGERRLTAAKKAGLKEVPCMVKALNDDEAFEAQITENLQRKDVHALKEGESYEAYMKQTGATIEDLVAKFAKTRDYIMQRLSFTQLIPELKKDFYANKMGAGHAALFARLTPANQKQCFQNCKVQYGAAQGQYKLIDDVKSFITQSIMMELKDVPWDLKDISLVVAAGSCVACPKRSGAGLFSDVSQKDRCFDGACFKLKMETFVINAVVDLVDNNKDMPVIKLQSHDSTLIKVNDILQKNKVNVLQYGKDYEKATASDKGSIRALIISGTQAGSYQQIKLKKQPAKLASSPGNGSTKTKSKAVSLKDQIARAEQTLRNVKENINDKVALDLKKKLFDFKPYKSPDPKKLTKYENAALLMVTLIAMGEIGRGRTSFELTNLIKKVKVPGGKPSARGYEVEQFANMPVDLANLIMRKMIDNLIDEDMGDDHVYLIEKLAEENSAISVAMIRAAAEKHYEKELQSAKKKLDELKTPTPVKKVPVKKAAKKK